MSKTKIGGQAVIEGVMMRGEKSMALAVRDETGVIRLETTRLKPKSKINKIPFIRGVVNLVASLVMGTKTLYKAAEIAGEEDATTDGKGFKAAMVVSMLLGLALALALFIFVPSLVPKLIERIFRVDLSDMGTLLIDNAVKVVIMLAYFVFCASIKDVRRVFMYHGAEHKTINCFEAEKELTVENVQSCSKHHDRCGTSFVVFVIIISVILMILTGVVAKACGFGLFFDSVLVRVGIKLLLLPLMAGISYEFLMLLAKTNFFLLVPFKWLGKQMQRLTTKQPDNAMCEVAIAAFNAVLALDADPSAETVSFPQPVTLKDFREEKADFVREKGLEADFDWILCSLLKVSRDKLNIPDLKIGFGARLKAEKMLSEVVSGKPLQYVLGSAQFFEYEIFVNQNVLIPRPETELLTEQALNVLTKGDTVLDLCCGSGCVGLTIAKKIGAKVTLADVSREALDIARKNAKRLKARVKIVKTDMFEKIVGVFDMIVCNPPYVKSAEIETLDANVKDFEPKLALDGGADGLDFYRVLARNAPRFLKRGGRLYLEVGYDQAQLVAGLLRENFDVHVKKDYDNVERMILAQKK